MTAARQAGADANTPIDHACRVAAIQTEIALGNGCDALLFADLVDVRWLTGFTGSNGWAVVTADELTLGTDGRYGERARAETASSGATVIAETSRLKLHERLIDSLGSAGSVGLDPVSTTHAEWRRLSADLALEPTESAVGIRRQLKDAAEIERMTAAAAAADAALVDVWGENLRWASFDPRNHDDYISLNEGEALVMRLGGEEIELCLLSQNEGRDLVVAGSKKELRGESLGALGLRVVRMNDPREKKGFLINWFLEELLLYASRARWSLEELWERLEELGWIQWSGRSQWTAVLQRRKMGPSLIGKKSLRRLNQEILAITDLEGARSFLEGQESRPQFQIPFRHFLGALCHVMSFVVSDRKEPEGLRDSTLFIAASLGVPRHSELPVYSHFDGGLRQTQLLLKQNWPEFRMTSPVIFANHPSL